MAPKLPTGSSSGGSGGRPRAQVAYEGEDEFSTMSLEPSRKEAIKNKETLTPNAPGSHQSVKVDELKSTNNNGVLAMLRRIFVK
jgi:hypothetical protein